MTQRSCGESADGVSLIPYPESVRRQPGSFEFRADTVLVVQPETAPIGRALAARLEPALGRCLPIRADAAGNPPAIHLRLDPAAARLGPEGYTLEVSPRRVVMAGASAAGMWYGMQTLLQLLPPDALRSAPVSEAPWRVPCLRIADRPRFAWRGLMLDTARTFMPTAFLKRLMDLMAFHKLNRFHWHLVDDQGWRLEIKRYPKLTAVGAWRAETVVAHGSNQPQYFDGVPHGGFYTQADVRELVAYARERHITIVPEIEMPGHAQAAIAAYPELGCTGRPVPVATRWGVHQTLFNVEERTFRFLQNVLAETTDLFPGPYIHIGGDEAVKAQWIASPRVQARRRALRLKDEHALQAWFIRRMAAFLEARGRRLVGWDEILEGGMTRSAVVMAWRGDGRFAVPAVKAGHDVVMAPSPHTYFDYYQSDRPDHEPLAIGGCLPLEKVYAFEPVPAGLTPRQATRILGAQGQLWSEYLPTPAHAEYMAFPRAAALAEVVWSPARARDWPGFQRRLSGHLARLDVLGVAYRRPRVATP